MCVYRDYGMLDYQPGFSTEFSTPITVLLTGVTHGMLHYWSTDQSSLTAVTLTVNPLFRAPRGGVFISNPFEGEGVGAFLEAGRN